MTTAETLSIIAILFSPLVALWIDGYLKRRNHFREQRLDVLRRVIAHSHELAPTSPSRSNILSALLEIKFWYHKDRKIIAAWMTFQQKLASGQVADEQLYELMTLLARKEKLRLSRIELIAGLMNK